MGTLLVKEAEVGLKPLSEISNAVIEVQIDMLVLHRAPEPFDKDVVHPPSFAIHADLDAVGLQDASELLAGELGGFNRSSQHRVTRQILNGCSMPPRESSNPTFYVACC